MPRLDSETDAAPDPYALDVLVPFGQSVRVGLLAAGLAALGVGWWQATVEVAWWVVPIRAALGGAGAGCTVALVLYVFDVADERRARHEGRRGHTTRLEVDDWHAEAETEPPPSVPIVIKRGEGRVHEVYADLPIPKVGEEALARYFWRVLREGRTLALRNPYKIGRDEVNTVKDFFTDNELGEDQGGNLGVKPNDEGEELMRQFVRRHYPDALPPRDDARGA